jgi:hypothetical protein
MSGIELQVSDSDVWYEVRAEINNREMVFLAQMNVDIFEQVIRESQAKFAFELRYLRLDGSKVSFYIKPAEIAQVPHIVKWIKQVFSSRFNAKMRRTGHVWGSSGVSRAIEGEPPEPASPPPLQ